MGRMICSVNLSPASLLWGLVHDQLDDVIPGKQLTTKGILINSEIKLYRCAGDDDHIVTARVAQKNKKVLSRETNDHLLLFYLTLKYSRNSEELLQRGRSSRDTSYYNHCQIMIKFITRLNQIQLRADVRTR